MNIEDRLRSALDADEAGWPEENWPAFHDRARASRRRRMVAGASVFAVLAAVIGFSAVAMRDSEPDFADPGVNRHVDGRTGYSIEVPKGWKIAEAVEGDTLLLQAPHAAGAEPPVEMIVVSDPGRAWADVVTWHEHELWNSMRVDGITVGPRQPARVGTRGAVMVDIEFADAPRPPNPASPGWCRGCKARQYVVDWGRLTVVRIGIRAADAATFEQYRETIDQTLISMRPWEGPDLYSPKGTSVAPIEQNARLRALLQFLDARVARAGAERWLAEPSVATSSILYGRADDPIAGYFITFEDEVGGQPRYSVCPADRGAAWIQHELIDISKIGDEFRVTRLHVSKSRPQSCFEPG